MTKKQREILEELNGSSAITIHDARMRRIMFTVRILKRYGWVALTHVYYTITDKGRRALGERS